MKKTLNSLVIEEAKKLKLNAKKSELKKLDFNKLEVDDPLLCIYGQMTGNCFSDRATQLIEKSCERVYKIGSNVLDAFKGVKLNGNPSKEKRDDYFSPIEVFIYKPINQKNGNNERLIKFLKDETKTLNLK